MVQLARGVELSAFGAFTAAQTHWWCPCPQPTYCITSSDYTITPEHSIYHQVSSAHWMIVWASQQGRECGFLPLGLIYCPVLGCYCTDLLLRPGVNCPALGSISNRTARDMGPDTSKCWHYIIPCCFGKWSLQTPPYKSLIIQKKEARCEGSAARECHILTTHRGEIQLIYHDKHTPSSPPSGGPMGVRGVSGHFLPE